MKFELFFDGLAAVAFYWGYGRDGDWLGVILYPIANLIIFGLAYTLKRPSWILGKRENGCINSLLLAVNLPWLLLAWTVWLIESRLSLEELIERIMGVENIALYIGRYPRWIGDRSYLRVSSG